jgi:hypothetical protein
MVSFKRASFKKDVVLEEMMQERGVSVDHGTISRWGSAGFAERSSRSSSRATPAALASGMPHGSVSDLVVAIAPPSRSVPQALIDTGCAIICVNGRRSYGCTEG